MPEDAVQQQVQEVSQPSDDGLSAVDLAQEIAEQQVPEPEKLFLGKFRTEDEASRYLQEQEEKSRKLEMAQEKLLQNDRVRKALEEEQAEIARQEAAYNEEVRYAKAIHDKMLEYTKAGKPEAAIHIMQRAMEEKFSRRLPELINQHLAGIMAPAQSKAALLSDEGVADLHPFADKAVELEHTYMRAGYPQGQARALAVQFLRDTVAKPSGDPRRNDNVIDVDKRRSRVNAAYSESPDGSQPSTGRAGDKKEREERSAFAMLLQEHYGPLPKKR